MKTLLLAASLSLTLASTAALAQPGQGHGHGHEHASGHDDGHGDDRGYGHAEHRGMRHDKGRFVHYDNGLHLGQYRVARGQRLPSIYMHPRYYVEDYRVYGLAPPPAGYRWVRPVDGRYLLIATATGLISQILGY
jgi:Ni/Co efflux regulator RcnB